MTAPFVIFSLPRSRSAWLSAFLSYQGRKCEHDLAPRSDSIAHFHQSLTSGIVGTVETGAVVGWRLIMKRFPDAKFLVVRRPVIEVIDSFRLCGLDVPPAEIEERAQLIDELSGIVGVPTVQFKSLKSEGCCAWVFRYLLGIEHDHEWWAKLANMNIQINMVERLLMLYERRDIIARLKEEVRAQCAA